MVEYKISLFQLIGFAVLVNILTLYSSVSALLLLIILIFFLDLFLRDDKEITEMRNIHAIDYITSCPKAPRENIPKWLKFPEYEKARFLNHITSVLWNPHMKVSLEKMLKKKMEWKMEVQKAKLRKIDALELSNIDLGTAPPIVSSIRSCEMHCDACSKHLKHDMTKCEQTFCSLEVDFAFLSDDMVFSLLVGYKKVKGTVSLSKISISGTVLLRLCDFVNVFPGFSSYTVSLINYPKFDFNLSFKTGALRVNYLPKISKIIEPMLKKTVWTSFIFPRKKKFSVKSRQVAELRDAGKLMRYGQKSQHREGSLAVNIRDVQWDISYSKDVDYSVPIMLANGHIYFQDELGFSWHCTAAIKRKQQIIKTKHIRSNTITRRLVFNEKLTFHEMNICKASKNGNMIDIDIRFGGKKWDEVLGQVSLNVNDIITKFGRSVKGHTADVVRFYNSGEVGWRKVATMKMDIIYTLPNIVAGVTDPKKTKLRDLMNESLKNNNYELVRENLRSVTLKSFQSLENLEDRPKRPTRPSSGKKRDSLSVKKPSTKNIF